MKHVPVPLNCLEQTSHAWLPFLDSIVTKTGQSYEQVLAQIYKGEVTLHLAYEPDENKAYALAGSIVLLQGENRVGRIIWATGFDRKLWFGLISDIERYHKEHLGCVEMQALCRPGWKSELKKTGYRVTHLLMEKRL